MKTMARLAELQRSLQARESFFLWMKTMQARGGFSEYWKIGDFVCWDSENGDANLLYILFFEINSAVQTAANAARRTRSWASLLALAMLGTTSTPKIEQYPGIRAMWRQKLCSLLEEAVALERAVQTITSTHFDSHDVLFSDVKREVAEMHESAKRMIDGYNCVAEENRFESIDCDTMTVNDDTVFKIVTQWCVLAHSSDLANRGRRFDARDVLTSWLRDGSFLIR